MSVDIRGVRVTPDCNPTGTNFFISQAANVQTMPDIAFGAGNYFVVWQDGRNANKYVIYGARVSPAGTVLDPAGIQVGPSDTMMQGCPSVVFTGTRFYTVWNYDYPPYRIVGRFVDTTGALSDTTGLYTGTYMATTVRMATSGSNFMLIWMEGTGGSGYLLKGLIVAADGTPSGPAFVVVPSVSKYAHNICFDGTNYFVCYGESPSTAIWGRKFDTGGVQIGPAFRVSNTGTGQNNCDVVAGANNRYLNVWSQFVVSNYDVYGNVDVLITGVAEGNPAPVKDFRLRSRIVRDAIVLEGAAGTETEIYDLNGCRVGRMNGGYFDCRGLVEGVYFLKTAAGATYRVIKI